MANLLLIMGGQLGYLYIVGPISMEEGNTMSLPEIPFIGFLIMILMAAGSMIIVAILQKMPAPVRYVTSNLKPYTKKIEKNIDDTSGKSYRSEYPGQFSSKSGKMFYSKGENTDDLNWGGLKPVSEQTSFKLGSIQRQVLQLPKSGVLFFLFLMSLALGLVALTERGPFIFLFPIAFVIAFAFPGLIWVSYIYSRTVTSPEPQRLVLIALAWGMFSTLPSSLLNDLGSRIVDVNQNALLGKGDFGTPELILVSVIAPFVEELLKPVGLIFILKRLKTPYEGVLYGVACGMGFAIIENMLYELFILLWYGSDAWTLNAFVRGIGSTVLHAVGPAAIGFAVAYSRQMEVSMKSYLIYAYIFGFVMHAAWNGFATLPLLKSGENWEYFSYLLIAIMIILCLAFIVKSLEYGKYYSRLELAAASFEDLEEETNSGH
ncbi:MAG: PrsW family intramembrane metalloprotease [Candidatus Thermoplasmatota archaeon]|nr:PrsW family intramembrane metalloprotease [Candidatus Thermoplasmatota archaeon]